MQTKCEMNLGICFVTSFYPVLIYVESLNCAIFPNKQTAKLPYILISQHLNKSNVCVCKRRYRILRTKTYLNHFKLTKIHLLQIIERKRWRECILFIFKWLLINQKCVNSSSNIFQAFINRTDRVNRDDESRMYVAVLLCFR